MTPTAPSRKPTRGMRIECSKRWEDMDPAGRDRCCDSCQKPVIDFTGWSREELIAAGVRAGIRTPDGQLTAPYRSDTKDE